MKHRKKRYKVKRIKHNDLTHYFMTPHEQLPASYVASCEKFFIDLKIKKALKDGAYKRWKKLLKQKAASRKLQAPSFKRHEKDTIIN